MEQVKVKRIIANFKTPDLGLAKLFYRDILGLDLLMDHGWIATYGNGEKMNIQISFASEGGSNTEVPDLSIEVDDVDKAYQLMTDSGFSVTYGPVNEPWGVRRFYIRDPFGKLINILCHQIS
jgi:catechol 2,3-dioxygenase-like lactoylglutathione lyase family enzyme